jgi:hypothetical protein
MKYFRWVSWTVVAACAFSFSQNNPAPLVNQLVPPSIRPGSGNFDLTVRGANFINGSVLYWNGFPRKTRFISADQLTAAISAEDVSRTTTASVSVANPAPGGGISTANYFSVQSPSPSIAIAPVRRPLEGGVPAVGDFDGDGKLDLVIANGCTDYSCDATLDFYAGKGDGTFATPIRTIIGPYSGNILMSVYVADFNADGKADLALSAFDGYGDDPVGGFVLLSNGDGTFSQSGTYQDNVVAVGDINGDGLPDLVSSGFAPIVISPEILVWLAKPDGTFTETQDFPYVGASGVALADFNGDGRLDMAIASSYSSYNYPWVSVAIGRGDGTFQDPVSYETPNSVYNVIAADVNGDGKLDLVTDGGCVLLGNGDGSFSPSACTASPQGSMILGDFNTDGKLDLAILGGSPPSINVFLGNGDGTFASSLLYQPPTPAVYQDQWNTLLTFSSADFENIGRPGFAVSGTPIAAVYAQTIASVTPTRLDFGDQLLFRTSPPQTTTLHNIENVPIRISEITIRGVNPGMFHQRSNCPPMLPGLGSCQIQTVFRPTSNGNKTAYLVVRYGGPNGPQVVPLSGNGTNPRHTFGRQQ